MTLDLHGCDLSADPKARIYTTRPVHVRARFALAAGQVQTLEGPVQHAAGAAVLTGASGERWPVERAEFDARYVPMGNGEYRKRAREVWALQVQQAFVTRAGKQGDVLQGRAGDWLVQYAPGEHGVVAQDRFDALYQLGDQPV